MDFVWPFAQLLEVADQLRVEVHDWFQIDFPKFFSDFVIEADIFVSDQVELVEFYVHTKICIPVVLELVFQFWQLLEQILGIVDTICGVKYLRYAKSFKKWCLSMCPDVSTPMMLRMICPRTTLSSAMCIN